MTTTILISMITLIVITAVLSLRQVILATENTQKLHYLNGKFIEILQPGRHIFWGNGHTFTELDSRLQPITLQSQELNTAEGLSIKLTAVGLFKVTDPLLAISSTTSYSDTLYTLIQLALRDLVNGFAAEELIARARDLSPQFLEKVQTGAAKLGLEVTELTIRDIILPNDLKNALSAAWRTKKEAIAELEEARGKAAAARTLANAAKLYSTNPELLKVRYLETLEKLSTSYGNTFVVGLPPDDTTLSIPGKTNN